MTSKTFYILLIILAATSSCKKDSAPATNTQSTSNACSTNGPLQDTVIDSGTKYFIIASSGANNVIATEFIYNGTCASNLTVDYLQAKNGTNCFESSSVTTLTPPNWKAYSFGSFPAWAIDTTTVCLLKVTINSTAYYLRDNKLNK